MFDNYKITLASASPRRRELLSGLDIKFTVEPNKDEKEAYSSDLPHDRIPEFLARHKSETFHRPIEENEVLLTADTLVFLGSDVLGKPTDRADAERILGELSGNTHTVLTGVCIRTVKETRSFTAATDVTFKELTDAEIKYYLDIYKPYDKAGAYGVQEWIGYVAITGINGSFYNVMGLPVQMLYEELCQMLKME